MSFRFRSVLSTSSVPVASTSQYSNPCRPAYVADVAARTAVACVRGGLPMDALEAAVRAACLAAMDAQDTRRPPSNTKRTATRPTPAPPTTYGHRRRRQQLRREQQERVQLHVSQAQARYTIGTEEAEDLQRVLNAVGSAQRAIMGKNEMNLRGGVGRAQTVARTEIGSEQRAQFAALCRVASCERDLCGSSSGGGCGLSVRSERRAR